MPWCSLQERTGTCAACGLWGDLESGAGMDVLVVDVGGSHVKILASGQSTSVRFTSGKLMTPKRLVGQISQAARKWKSDAISIGIPGLMGPSGPEKEPGNLGRGWVGFDFAAAFGKPVRHPRP